MNPQHPQPLLPDIPVAHDMSGNGNGSPNGNDHPHDTGEEIPKDLPTPTRWMLALVGIVAVVFLLILLVVGTIPKLHQNKVLDERAKAAANDKPVVQTVLPKPEDETELLKLPGDVNPLRQTQIYPQITGYLKDWKFDVGAHVTPKDVLAVIDAPEIDANLRQAQADESRAADNVTNQQASYELASNTFERYKGLVPSHAVTQQQLDEKQTQMNNAHAALLQAQDDVKSTHARVESLKAQQDYEVIHPPFEGVVTARRFDLGALLTASSANAGQAMFDIQQVDKLKVIVNVPQSYVPLIHLNDTVDLVTGTYPGKQFPGVVARTTVSLNPATRTLQVECDFDNPEGLLHAGMYGELIFHLRRHNPTLTIPTSALLFEANGTQVAITGADQKVHFQKVAVGRDLGTEMEILTGLNGKEHIIANPDEQLVDGLEVTEEQAMPETPVAESTPTTSPVRVAEDGGKK